MKCPSCGAPFSTPPAECPRCKLTLAQLDRKFGLVPYCSRYMSDRTERLPMEEIDALRSLLRVFHKKFPQIVFCVLVIDLGEEVSISEYGFWLINRARFGGAGIIGAKNFDLFFVIDPKGRAAGLIAGYGLEAYLSEQDLQDALAVANSGFDAGDLICGMRECIEFLTIRVREIVLRIEESRALENRAAILTANSDAS